MNELLLVLSLLISFGSTVLFLKLFGKSGEKTGTFWHEGKNGGDLL